MSAETQRITCRPTENQCATAQGGEDVDILGITGCNASWAGFCTVSSCELGTMERGTVLDLLHMKEQGSQYVHIH
jgi:hypothetical protein